MCDELFKCLECAPEEVLAQELKVLLEFLGVLNHFSNQKWRERERDRETERQRDREGQRETEREWSHIK